MKQQNFNRFGSLFVLLAALLVFTGCVSQTATPAKAEKKAAAPAVAKAAAPEAKKAATDIKMGHYENKEVGFSIAYPADVFSVENKVEGNIVLFRENSKQVPSILVRVDDIPAGVALDQIGEWFVADYKAASPNSDRFKIVESKMVKLKTGVDAHQTLMKWRYEKAVPVYTAVVSAYKNGKAIHVLTTSVPGQPATDVLMQMAMALKVML